MSNDHDHLPPSFSVGRKFGAGFGAFVSVVALLAILVMANYLASRHYVRRTLTTERNLALSPVTRQVLAALTNVVKVTVYFDPEEPLYSHVTGLLKEYSLVNPKIVVDVVNYRLEPGKAEQIKATYKLSPAVKDVIIFDGKGRLKIVKQAELSEFDLSKLFAGKGGEIKRKGFNGEQHFTSALISVTDRVKPRAMFLTGHGEHDPRNATLDEGYAKFAALLDENNIEWGGLTLFGTNEVPADCQLLVIAGPAAVFDSVEHEKLERYLNQGGRVLALLRYSSVSGLERVLAKWGVEAGDTLVIDRSISKSDSFILLGSYGSHEIVKPLANASLPLAIALPRAVGPSAGAAAGADTAQVVRLAWTSSEGIAIRDHRNGAKPSVTDRRGEIPVMVAVEKSALKGETVSRGSTRLVVVGDSYFLDNANLANVGNREFAWNAVNWLLDRSQLLGIAARPIREYTFTMSDVQMFDVQWILLLGVPGAVMLVGTLVWFRRRA